MYDYIYVYDYVCMDHMFVVVYNHDVGYFIGNVHWMQRYLWDTKPTGFLVFF